MKITLLAFLLLMMTTSCLDRTRYVRAYQEKATADCLKSHTVEQCKPLSYPPCDENGCHN
jgi:hypothetical protein